MIYRWNEEQTFGSGSPVDVSDIGTISFACREWELGGEVGSLVSMEWGSRVHSGESRDLRYEGSTAT
jgi:hypothetical protein